MAVSATGLDVQEALDALTAVRPAEGGDLRAFFDRPFVEFASHLYRPCGRASNDIMRQSRDLFFDALTARCDPAERSRLTLLIDQLENNGVIQAGPHCELILSRFPFSTAITSLVGLNSRSLVFNVTYGCTTNKLETRCRTGPGWLEHSQGSLNLFELPRKYMQKTSLIAATKPVSLSLDPTHISYQSERGVLTRLAAILGSCSKASLIETIRFANKRLWRHFTGRPLESWIDLDEHFFSDVVRRQIEFRGPICRVLFSPDRRTGLLRALSDCASRQGGHMIPNGTDFFWHLENDRIHSLRLDGDFLVSADGRQPYRLPLVSEEIVRALKAGEIVPNVFLVYVAGFLLTGFRPLGGLFQMAYLAPFTEVLGAVMPDRPAFDQGYRAAGYQGGLGAGLFRGAPNVLLYLAEVGDALAVATAAQSIHNLKLRDVANNLKFVRDHGSWGVWLKQMAQETQHFSDRSEPPSPRLPKAQSRA